MIVAAIERVCVRSALARALASPGGLVIADEPFSAISASNRDPLRRALRDELGDRACSS